MATTFTPAGTAPDGTKVYRTDRSREGLPIVLKIAPDGDPVAWWGQYPLGTGLEQVTLLRDWAAYLWGMLPALGGAE